jgi:hypothetical protein
VRIQRISSSRLACLKACPSFIDRRRRVYTSAQLSLQGINDDIRVPTCSKSLDDLWTLMLHRWQLDVVRCVPQGIRHLFDVTMDLRACRRPVQC